MLVVIFLLPSSLKSSLKIMLHDQTFIKPYFSINTDTNTCPVLLNSATNTILSPIP